MESYYIIFLSGIAIIPLLILAFFAHPAVGDDYLYTTLARQNGFWETQKMMYFEWTGRFFATALLSINPLVFGWMFGYKLLPLLLIFLLLHSFYLFIKEITGSFLSVKTTLSLALALFFLYAFNMPSLSEGIYWMTGTFTYQLANIFTLYFFALLIRFYRTEKFYKRLLLMVILVFLLIAIIGSNETIMLIFIALLGVVFGYRLYVTKKMDALLSSLFVIAILTFAVVILSPGNTERVVHFPHRLSLMGSILLSITGSGSMMVKWFIPTVLFTILFIPVGFQISNNLKNCQNHFTVHPLVSTGVLLIIVFLSFLPAAWSRGDLGPPRVQNIAYLFFLKGWFFNIGTIVSHFNIAALKFEKLLVYVYPIVGVAIVCSLFLQHNNIALAYSNLLNKEIIEKIISLDLQSLDLRGTAFLYDIEMRNRYKTIQQCQDDICEVDKLTSHPYAIFSEDLQEDENDMRNTTFASYFKKKGVRLRQANNPGHE
ncbi:MAG: DUF6056 family protein [candidate division KSB1 bacterium]|nr:DUF6056 family protein [candidate division KSB1 bacterium]